ncbi:MAG: putative phosphoglycerate mutase protein [Candidatus Saccharibacteria bacterium]|nr:putative phosphoglycerate mutase protein [Candidatus Saccharibacteria bacterium]
MPGIVYVVRHGQDEDNAAGLLNGHRDTPLTALGRAQATIIAEKLLGHGIAAIYSSPLKRAHETASIIANTIGLNEVIIEPDLIEREFGIMTGKPVADIAKYSKNNFQGDKILYFLDPQGAETFPVLLERAKRVLHKIQTLHPTGKVVLVAHGDIGKLIRAAYHNWTWEQAIATPYLDNTGVLELEPNADVIE